MKKALLFFLPLITFAQTPPQDYVSKGCRCLECPYYQKGENPGTWKAKKAIPLFKTPGKKDEPIAQLNPGEVTTALSGEIRNKPGRLEVIFQNKNYQVGDSVYVLQGDSESNIWKVWCNGTEGFENLSQFVSQKQPCKVASPACWAKVKEPMKSEWWVEIQTKGNITGWTDAVENFDFDRSSCL